MMLALLNYRKLYRPMFRICNEWQLTTLSLLFIVVLLCYGTCQAECTVVSKEPYMPVYPVGGSFALKLCVNEDVQQLEIEKGVIWKRIFYISGIPQQGKLQDVWKFILPYIADYLRNNKKAYAYNYVCVQGNYVYLGTSLIEYPPITFMSFNPHAFYLNPFSQKLQSCPQINCDVVSVAPIYCGLIYHFHPDSNGVCRIVNGRQTYFLFSYDTLYRVNRIAMIMRNIRNIFASTLHMVTKGKSPRIELAITVNGTGIYDEFSSKRTSTRRIITPHGIYAVYARDGKPVIYFEDGKCLTLYPEKSHRGRSKSEF